MERILGTQAALGARLRYFLSSRRCSPISTRYSPFPTIRFPENECFINFPLHGFLHFAEAVYFLVCCAPVYLPMGNGTAFSERLKLILGSYLSGINLPLPVS